MEWVVNEARYQRQIQEHNSKVKNYVYFFWKQIFLNNENHSISTEIFW